MAEVSRNDACPCGSGKKYKQCHMNADTSQAPKLRSGPVIGAIVGVLAGLVLMATHGLDVGGPVAIAGIVLPIAWASFSEPPPPKANADDAAALRFGK